MPFLSMGFPVRLVSRWVAPLEHFICQPEAFIQTSNEISRRSRKFRRVSASQERVEVRRARRPQPGHNKVGTAMPNGSECMIDNDPLRRLHHNEIV